MEALVPVFNARGRAPRDENEGMLCLARSAASRGVAGGCGLAVLLAAIGWLAFCLTATPGPSAARGAGVIIRLLGLVSLPMLAFAALLIRDAASRAQIELTRHALRVSTPGALRRPITIVREHVEAVIVDAGGFVNLEERLRFAVDNGGFLYSSISGSDLAFLGSEATVPNLALVFERPLVFPQARRRWLGRTEFAPLRPLSPGQSEPGVLLTLKDPAGAERALYAWLHPDGSPRETARIDADLAPGDNATPVSLSPTLRHPLTEPVLARRRLLSRFFAAAFGLGVTIWIAAGHAAGAVNAVILAMAAGCIVAGITRDTKLHDEERGTLARLPSVALVAIGLVTIFIVALQASTPP
jgi:hypothetical protein